MNKKIIPIGISDYKMLIENNYYFVDKTDFIRQIIEEGALITMLPRPRRFGKTLNLSMLRYFFERTEGNVFRPLFDGMNITKWKDFDRYQGKYPVIMITLKDCKGETFEQTLEQLGNELKKEFERHAYLLESMDTLTDNKEVFLRILKRQASQNELTDSLRLLTDLLATHWGISPLVLFDEYDSPIHVAFDHGYYDQMINFIRSFMSPVFKDNTDVFRGVITGILRVSKESLFSGLNNIEVDTILDHSFSTAFGFTQEETDQLLNDYGYSASRVAVKEWYDGYLFAGKTIYNPWSLLSFIQKRGVLAPYWVNTGSDVLLRYLIANGPTQVRRDMEVLLKDGNLRYVINDKLAFPDLLKSADNIWSFMLFSGYLKASEYCLTENDMASYRLEIPNREIETVFRNIIQNWIDSSPEGNARLQEMLKALIVGELDVFEELLNDFVINTLSYFDTAEKEVEKVYQAFLLGMLINLSDYEVSSNREAGFGRYDILMRPKDLSRRGFVLELKRLLKSETAEQGLARALKQIADKQYAATLRAAGVTDILCLAITFDGKRVWVKEAEK